MTDPTPVRNISNSEVTTFLSCKRQYDYAFIENLEPKETSTPLARGTVGHYYFELYAKARIAGLTHEDALREAEKAFTDPPVDIALDELMKTQFIVSRYMDFHKGWPEYEIIGSEEKLDLPLTPTINMTIRYDLFVRHKVSGKQYIWDFKFAYNFWTPEDHELNGQMPKYVAVLQANGIQCDGGMLEEIRTRDLSAASAKDPKNLWRRTTYIPSAARKQSVLRQHVAASLQIERHRSLTPEERRNESLPVLNKHGACKYCNFKSLCVPEIEGKRDLSVDIRTGYRPNTYGYNQEQEGLDF